MVFSVYCLDQIKFDSCVALKSKIVEEPSFEIFDKVQEILFNIRDFIFDVTDNLENKIDKAESLYLSRPICNNAMKFKQFSNVIQSAMSATNSMKRKLQNYIATINSRKIPKPPPDYSKEIKQVGFQLNVC